MNNSPRFSTNIRRYIIENADTIYRTLCILSIVIAFLTIASLFYYHGFYIPENHEKIIHGCIVGNLIFFVLKYLFLWFYADNRKQYFRKHLVEEILLVFFVVYYFFIILWSSGIENTYSDLFQSYYVFMFFLQLYFLVVSSLELTQASKVLSKISITPPVIMMISFFILIILGTILLMMPRMTHEGISFTDALFTSTSASCVTGLTVLNTGSDFTFRGQIVIMLLMQFGGIRILVFATFFAAFFAASKMGIKQQHLLKDYFSTSTITDSISMLREIILATIFIETAGIISLYFYWNSIGLFANSYDTIFYSFFHSISAFTNAGFCLWDDSFMNAAIAHSYFPQSVVMVLIVMGGMGFIFLHDVFSPIQIKERHQHKWKRLTPSTKIVFYTTFVIIASGAVIFFFLEKNNSLSNSCNGVGESVLASVFQIVTSRSAGFNSLNVSTFSVPALLLIMIVMFIGASPGSTGGGIKTTTAFVIFKSVFATIRGKNNIEFQKKTIPFEIVDKTYSIVVMSFIIILISVFTLAIVEPHLSFIELLFESVSAFSICGLSMGCTPELSEAGKLILVVNMYIGRIGTLSIAFALARRIKHARHQYPNTNFMVG
jgi:potassium uptake TrkH family protein